MRDLAASAKQNEATIRAMLVYYNMPEPGRVLFNAPDRVIFAASLDEIEWLRTVRQPSNPKKRAFKKRTLGIGLHHHLEGYEAIDGYQETRGRLIGRFVMQPIVLAESARFEIGDVHRGHAIEYDVDGFGCLNPIAAIPHMGAWLWQRVPKLAGKPKRMTNQWDAREWLVKHLGVNVPLVEEV